MECIEGADRPRVDARFVGYNEHRAFGKWSTTSQIVAHDEPREFAWAVGDSENPSATWRFRLAPRDGGTRTPILVAQTAITLSDLSNGRFLLSQVRSGPQVVEGLHGVRFSRPPARIAETVDIVRQVFAGGKISYPGNYF